MLTPSIGTWGVPLTIFGSGSLAASRIVGATSITWWNWLRISFFALMPFGQWTTMPLRVPPKLDATCLVHVERRVEGHRPARRHVRVGLGRSPLVQHLQQVRHLLLARR